MNLVDLSNLIFYRNITLHLNPVDLRLLSKTYKKFRNLARPENVIDVIDCVRRAIYHRSANLLEYLVGEFRVESFEHFSHGPDMLCRDVRQNDSNMVRSLRNYGCCWTPKVFGSVFELSDVQMIDFSYASECSRDESSITTALRNGNLWLFETFHRLGCRLTELDGVSDGTKRATFTVCCCSIWRFEFSAMCLATSCLRHVVRY
jgi:hypothetical protein